MRQGATGSEYKCGTESCWVNPVFLKLRSSKYRGRLRDFSSFRWLTNSGHRQPVPPQKDSLSLGLHSTIGTERPRCERERTPVTLPFTQLRGVVWGKESQNLEGGREAPLQFEEAVACFYLSFPLEPSAARIRITVAKVHPWDQLPCRPQAIRNHMNSFLLTLSRPLPAWRLLLDWWLVMTANLWPCTTVMDLCDCY